MEDPEPSKSRLLTGYLSAIGSIVCSALSSSCTQALRGAVPDFQLSAMRAVVQVVVFMVFGLLAGSDLKIERMTTPGLVYLGAAYMLMNIGLFGATAYIPLAEMFGVLMVGTIVTAFLHSRVVYKKDIAPSSIISALVCVVGIILAIQPPWLFMNKSKVITNTTINSFQNISQDFHPMNHSSLITDGVLQGYLLAFIGGIGFGLTYDIGGIMLNYVKPLAKSLYAAVFCTITSVVVMFYVEEPVLMLTTTQWMFVSGHAVLSVGTSYLTIQGAHYVPGPSLSALFCIEVIAMLVCQYTIMHSIQPGNYNWIEVIGCVIIAFGASISSLVEMLILQAKANELS